MRAFLGRRKKDVLDERQIASCFAQIFIACEEMSTFQQLQFCRCVRGKLRFTATDMMNCLLAFFFIILPLGLTPVRER